MERAAAEYHLLRFAGRGICPRGAAAASSKEGLDLCGAGSLTACARGTRPLEFPLHEHDIHPAFELQSDAFENADMLKAERRMQSY